MTKLIVDKSNQSAVILLTTEYVRGKVNLEEEDGQKNVLEVASGVSFTSPASICRYLVRAAPNANLYGSGILQRAEVDHWVDFSNARLGCPAEFDEALVYLDMVLAPATVLVGHDVTLADLAVWGALRGNPQFQQLGNCPVNVGRYFKFLSSKPEFQKVESMLPASKKPSAKQDAPVKKERKEEGKFIELPGAKIGEVVVRFPPEASGFLHVGHAKAALLNQYYQQTFKGKLIMRFDDTNPAKENADFEKVILEDIKLLGLEPDVFTHTSDHFDLMLSMCEGLLRAGKAYVDDTDAETMKKEREERVESRNRSNTVERNLAMWELMKAGTDAGLKCAVRAKMNMASDNGCLRDPTIYRCKPEPHIKTGTKYKVYPTYDFACPIVDSIEGVTHALRTTEYHDRDDQYYWFIEAMDLRKPYIWEYSRLNLQNTVMSKRKLTWFVEEGLVDGWDDPRLPTVRGVMRRGMTVEGLKEFVIAQGSSRSVVMMDWDKIWAFNKKVIDPVVPRYTALEKASLVPVHVSGAKEESVQVQKHPKDPAVGMKQVWYGGKVWVEGADAQTLTLGETVTFINWGNLVVTELKKDIAGKVIEVKADLNLENKDYKKTQKLTWLPDTERAELVSTLAVHFDNIITKAVLAKEDDFKDFINKDSRHESLLVGDPELATLKKGDFIQLQRRGYFICDSPYQPTSRHTSRASPCVLLNIPDGHTKEMPKAGSKHKDKETGAKERAQSKKGKAAEKSPQDEQPPSAIAGDVAGLSGRIAAQGETVRQLKTAKAAKADVDKEVKMLLSLKAEYKKATGQDWKPGAGAGAGTGAGAGAGVGGSSPAQATDLDNRITQQGAKIRQLKSEMAAKAAIDAEVKALLALKAEYKAAVGKDWKPGPAPPAGTPAAAPVKAAPQSAAGSSGAAADLDRKIAEQGNKIRDLKAQKKSKADVDPEVKALLALKAEYKAAVGKDWKPGAAPPAGTPVKAEPAAATGSSDAATALDKKITEQGNKIRDLKAQKKSKAETDPEVKALLGLKAEYKAAVGKDWKPGPAPPAGTPAAAPPAETPAKAEPATGTGSPCVGADLDKKITEQGNKIRDLKAQKKSKADVDVEVKVLLSLKADYKKQTGKDWKPGATPAVAMAPPAPAAAGSDQAADLKAKVETQGEKVRSLKSSGASKDEVDVAVKALLALKLEYKDLTGADLAGGGGGGRGDKKKSKGADKAQPEKQKKDSKQKEEKSSQAEGDSAREVKKVTRLGLEMKKEENLSDWYSQVITKAEMIEYYDVSGCYVFRPWSFSIWEQISKWFDAKIKEIGFENCYFPMFVSAAALEKEKEHIEDFAPEVAWVTRSGQSELAEPIAVRPTSETVMYPSYSKWVQSHRDLPIKLNQWCNVVRWEFKHPQPFLRTREFLWQEGHSAYATYEEARHEVHHIIDLYEEIYETMLAIPVVKGKKTQKEKFAGGDYTTTVEAYISASGRGIQAATSHHLGQNFSKMFDISFEDPETHEKQFAYQNSWAITTRSIGVIVMVHGDNKGLVLPPRIACIQAVLVPCGITSQLSEADRKALVDRCDRVVNELKAAGIRVRGDYRDNYSPGWKFNHWELKGVPLRIEVGPRDLKQNQMVIVKRHNGDKVTVSMDNAVQTVTALLDTIHDAMFAKAKKELDENLSLCYTFEDFCSALDRKHVIYAPFCGGIACEDEIKKLSARDAVVEEGAPAMGAKGLCIPFTQPAELKPQDKCVRPGCQDKPQFFTLFGRSY